MDDIPSVTALHQDEDAAKCQLVLGMTCLHRGISPMDDIPSVTALHQDATIASGKKIKMKMQQKAKNVFPK